MVGVVDGVFAVVRSPAGVLTPPNTVLVVFHCVAVLVTVGLIVGASQELVLAAALRRPVLVALGRFVIGGPARWFARSPAGAVTVLTGGLYLAAAIAPALRMMLTIITSFHSKQLAALAVLGLFLVMPAVAGVFVVVVAWPIELVVRRLGRFASPGVALVLVGVVFAVLSRGVVLNALRTLRAVDGVPFAIGAAALGGNFVVIVAASIWVERRARPVRLRAVAAALAATVVAFVASTLTFGARQSVASTIFMRSKVAGVMVRALQSVVDLDRDGYSAIYGGRDCNDLDKRIHPGARDVPGNGVDENCTGADALPEQDLGDGQMAEVTGPLAGVRPSFVLLSIDTLRADHVGAYGYRRPTTPNIDRFAASAARFTHAHCTSPTTILSISSLWTGRYPGHIAWGSEIQYPQLLEENATISETLGAAGYATAAFYNTEFFQRTPGFLRGFAETHAPRETGPAAWKTDPYDVASALERYLTERADDPRPFLAWAHLMEPHQPYRKWTTPRDFGPKLLDHYDEEVARADDVVGRMLAAVDAMAARRPVVVVVFSDHGEAFGEHGFYYHSSDLHEEQVHVPLLVRGPGIPPGERPALVSLMDLNPTLLNYAAHPAPRPVDARSLVGVLQDPSVGAAPGSFRSELFMEVAEGLDTHEQNALLEPPWKLILDVRGGFFQLHDLDRDPGEEKNFYDRDPERAARMRGRLMSWIDAAGLAQDRSVDFIAAARLPREPRRMDVPLHVKFGNFVEVLGCDLPTPTVRVGEVFRAVLYYRVLDRTSHPHSFDVVFSPDDGGETWERANLPHSPVSGRYSTTEWKPGEILRDDVPLRVEADVRATGYSVRLRIRNEHTEQDVPPDGERADGDDLVLGHLEVLP